MGFKKSPSTWAHVWLLLVLKALPSHPEPVCLPPWLKSAHPGCAPAGGICSLPIRGLVCPVPAVEQTSTSIWASSPVYYLGDSSLLPSPLSDPGPVLSSSPCFFSQLHNPAGGGAVVGGSMVSEKEPLWFASLPPPYLPGSGPTELLSLLPAPASFLHLHTGCLFPWLLGPPRLAPPPPGTSLGSCLIVPSQPSLACSERVSEGTHLPVLGRAPALVISHRVCVCQGRFLYSVARVLKDLLAHSELYP